MAYIQVFYFKDKKYGRYAFKYSRNQVHLNMSHATTLKQFKKYIQNIYKTYTIKYVKEEVK